METRIFLCGIFIFFLSDFAFFVFAGFVLRCHHYILYYSNNSDSEAQTQQTQKLQNLTEKNENAAQKNARFHFFRSIF